MTTRTIPEGRSRARRLGIRRPAGHVYQKWYADRPEPMGWMICAVLYPWGTGIRAARQPRPRLEPSACPCAGWAADMRVHHWGTRHHPMCNGRGGHDGEAADQVETDADGWCVCEMHQRWKQEAAS
ncbi:MAG TPA: hypothetical protein VFQ42_04205 [Mycobacterium sp.]|nr:hypothetical protein [Mycobacterium sp.]